MSPWRSRKARLFPEQQVARSSRAGDTVAHSSPVREAVRKMSYVVHRIPNVSDTFKDCRRRTTLSYLAGLLEGEGSFMKPSPSGPNQSAIVLSMTDEDVVRRAALLLEASCRAVSRQRTPRYKTAYVVRVRGRRAVEIMQAIYPLMSIRRQGQITAALGARNLITYRIPFATEIARMVEMKAAGKSRVEIAQRYDIDPKSVNRLLRGSVRSLDAALMQAAEIESTEEVLETSVHGDPDLAWLAGIIEGEGGSAPVA